MFSNLNFLHVPVLLFALTTSAENVFLKNHQLSEFVNQTNPELSAINTIQSANISEKLITNCGGSFKSLQTTVTTPNYPNKYPPNVRCEYVFKSPYVCENEFHVQFLDFSLEASEQCSKDRLCIGNQKALCGQVIGIKVFNTSDGLFRMVFQSDGSKEFEGFRLLVTRLPCKEKENSASKSMEVPVYRDTTVPKIWRKNFSDVIIGNDINNKQYLPAVAPPIYQELPVYGPSQYPSSYPNYPVYTCIPQAFNPIPSIPQRPDIAGSVPNFPNPPFYPIDGRPPSPPLYPNYPNYPPNNLPNQPMYPNVPQQPSNYPTYPEIVVNRQFTNRIPQVEPQVSALLPRQIPQCCRTTFNQRSFYLSSPGFPNSRSNPTDCLFYIERFGPNTCRLRIEFKYFALGFEDPQGCLNNFFEIDNQRICGCRTGLIYTSQWGLGAKVIRLRTSGGAQMNGFLLDVIQEDCPSRYMRNILPEKRSDRTLQKALVETNSTFKTLYTFFAPDDDSTISKESFKDESSTEGPSSQFLFRAFNSNSCSFSFADWLRLSVDPMWIKRPTC